MARSLQTTSRLLAQPPSSIYHGQQSLSCFPNPVNSCLLLIPWNNTVFSGDSFAILSLCTWYFMLLKCLEVVSWDFRPSWADDLLTLLWSDIHVRPQRCLGNRWDIQLPSQVYSHLPPWRILSLGLLAVDGCSLAQMNCNYHTLGLFSGFGLFLACSNLCSLSKHVVISPVCAVCPVWSGHTAFSVCSVFGSTSSCHLSSL